MDENGASVVLNMFRGGVLKIYDYNCPVNVQGYDPSLGAKQYSTISGALAYVNPFTGLKYHLIFHQAIHMPDLYHHLLCPCNVVQMVSSSTSVPGYTAVSPLKNPMLLSQ